MTTARPRPSGNRNSAARACKVGQAQWMAAGSNSHKRERPSAQERIELIRNREFCRETRAIIGKLHDVVRSGVIRKTKLGIIVGAQQPTDQVLRHILDRLTKPQRADRAGSGAESLRPDRGSRYASKPCRPRQHR
jgi:hypothetical protein